MNNSGNRFNPFSNIIPFPRNSDPIVPELNEMLKDEELADFFRYVDRNDLRAEALELLEKRLGDNE